MAQGRSSEWLPHCYVSLETILSFIVSRTKPHPGTFCCAAGNENCGYTIAFIIPYPWSTFTPEESFRSTSGWPFRCPDTANGARRWSRPFVARSCPFPGVPQAGGVNVSDAAVPRPPRSGDGLHFRCFGVTVALVSPLFRRLSKVDPRRK